MKKKGNVFIYILILGFVIAIGISLYNIIIWKMDNDKGKKNMDYIKDDIKVIRDSNNEEKYEIDFASLKSKNSDVVAFLKVNGTSIEYPVVRYSDNSFYLNHSFDKSSNGAGWVFGNYLNKFDGSDRNITIFAHSRYDGSMFGTLYKTLDDEWYNNKDNWRVLFVTESGYEYYEVFSNYMILSEDYYIRNEFSSDDEWLQFLKTISSRSGYDYGYEATVSDKVITLSTCAGDDKYRIVLHAKKIIDS